MKVTTRRKENKIKNDNITHRVCLVVDFIEKSGQIRLGSDDKEPRALALETEKVGHKCRMRLINNRMEGKQGTSMEVGRLCEMLCLLVFSLAFPSAARAYIHCAMERCPPEIWHEIFTLICDDGGYMARSLSLVSRYFHDVSRSVMMQSVICNGADEIIAFASILDRTPAHHRVVRHLFATFFSLPAGDGKTISAPLRQSPTSIVQFFANTLYPRRTECKTGQTMSLYRKVYNSLLRILTAIAPTLRTLSLAMQLSTWPQLPFPPAFPVLVELSIQHAFAGGCLRGDTFDLVTAAPRLRRLILSGFLRVIDPLGVVNSIQRFAPMLTHIGVPAEPGNIKPMVHRIATMMDRNARESGGNGGRMAFPGTLEDLVIEASPSGDPPSRIMANGNRRFVCANRPRSRRLECRSEMLLHWLARMDGKGGYWRTDAKVDDIVERLDVSDLMLSITFHS